MAARSLPNADKQHMLLQAAGIASNAAAIALIVGQSPAKVVGWLEMGRGILAGNVQDLRTDLAMLQERHSDLAASFDNSRGILDGTIKNESILPRMSHGSSIRLETEKRRQAHHQLETTVQAIRKQPEFERFLLPPAEDEILAAANSPIVIINVSCHRCDALIVLPSGFECIKLSSNLYHDIQEHRMNLTSPSKAMLEWLWDYIVSPVLTRLEILAPTPSGQQWPRIWWIPTGPLVGFPLHAAGYHQEEQGRTTLDRVVSSYAISIRSIRGAMHTREQPHQETPAGSRIALVTMTDTPELSPLHFASLETRSVQAVCQSMGLKLMVPVPCKREVLSVLQSSQIFHFAGHGGTHDDPLKSLLLLKDWKTDPLTSDSILQTNLSFKAPFLAYLSACRTGQVRNKDSVDESIHLTAAYQLAGFRHVIGTLWSVDDSICVEMARMIYEVLRDDGINDKAVREGLHRASRRLRDVWVQNDKVKIEAFTGRRSERDGKLDDDTARERPALWVPYVHYGA
ncbi:hypothetical protein PFICI_12425 [Pestalotiopsis fici W106-1]|uniref:CHAT domain-containing protein n=1 Tax=Pestalotiopsis fici (strain W106-1 / CGMCC3.15140) TaxID=1229662 RepID=W3WRN5_PESFW|nr:uncharacterized protein PFICI_12425 [Pestalotiopsis fici W106-1]ETS75481.1 hypothetical protein PFICI_12425 [Pestalotiopsis fici W106-1]